MKKERGRQERAPRPPRAQRVDRRGEVGVLNVGVGDTKLSFDKSNPAERKHAARVVSDMLKRGYAILVHVGEKDGEPLYQRAKAFDPETCEYIIVGVPDRDVAPARESVPLPPRARQPRKAMRVQADTTNAVAIARSAGG